MTFFFLYDHNLLVNFEALQAFSDANNCPQSDETARIALSF